MHHKVVLLSMVVMMILFSGCSQDNTSGELDALRTEYDNLLDDYNNQVAENQSLEESMEELQAINDNTIMTISEMESALEQSGQDIMTLQKANFWEQGFRMNFEGEPYLQSDAESIADLEIGDTLRMVIDKYGRDFEVAFSDDGFEPIVMFQDFAFSIDVSSYCITELFLASDKYETKLGVKIGDNAMEAMDIYGAVYPSNEDGSIHPDYPQTLFDIGDGYVIQFYTDTEELTESSIIIRINIRSFWHGEV